MAGPRGRSRSEARLNGTLSNAAGRKGGGAGTASNRPPTPSKKRGHSLTAPAFTPFGDTPEIVQGIRGAANDRNGPGSVVAPFSTDCPAWTCALDLLALCHVAATFGPLR